MVQFNEITLIIYLFLRNNILLDTCIDIDNILLYTQIKITHCYMSVEYSYNR